MTWISAAALYFIVWWLTLFAILPFSLRTQDDEREIVLGTVSSAPKGPHMLRAMIRTTIVSAALLGSFYLVTRGLGLTIDDIPQIIPEFR